jgi:hypothetical protein
LLQSREKCLHGRVVFPAAGEFLHRALATQKDSLPMQFYKSLTEEQRAKICLAVDHPKRQFVSNWWYVCPEQRLHTFYTTPLRSGSMTPPASQSA